MFRKVLLWTEHSRHVGVQSELGFQELFLCEGSKIDIVTTLENTNVPLHCVLLSRSLRNWKHLDYQ